MSPDPYRWHPEHGHTTLDEDAFDPTPVKSNDGRRFHTVAGARITDMRTRYFASGEIPETWRETCPVCLDDFVRKNAYIPWNTQVVMHSEWTEGDATVSTTERRLCSLDCAIKDYAYADPDGDMVIHAPPRKVDFEPIEYVQAGTWRCGSPALHNSVWSEHPTSPGKGIEAAVVDVVGPGFDRSVVLPKIAARCLVDPGRRDYRFVYGSAEPDPRFPQAGAPLELKVVHYSPTPERVAINSERRDQRVSIPGDAARSQIGAVARIALWKAINK